MSYIFIGEINETKMLHNVLKAISSKEYAVIRIMEEGIKVTIEDLKSMQTSAYIPADVFISYTVKIDTDNEELEKFKINLKLFVEFLNLFGDEGKHTIKIKYKAYGSPLCLLMVHEDENIIVDCELITLECEEIPDIILPDTENINNIIVKAGPFMSLLSEIDDKSDFLEILTSPDPPYFQISSVGTLGESHVDISKFSEIIENFKCSHKLSSQYLYSNIKLLLKIMNLARKISISISPNGVLGIQVIVNCENESKIYVEYFITALLE